jgi:hypothetical protein
MKDFRSLCNVHNVPKSPKTKSSIEKRVFNGLNGLIDTKYQFYIQNILLKEKAFFYTLDIEEIHRDRGT